MQDMLPLLYITIIRRATSVMHDLPPHIDSNLLPCREAP